MRQLMVTAKLETKRISLFDLSASTRDITTFVREMYQMHIWPPPYPRSLIKPCLTRAKPDKKDAVLIAGYGKTEQPGL